MQPITYSIEVNDTQVLAVIVWTGQRGVLVVSYDDRSVSFKLGPQSAFLREDAVRALTARRALAEMSAQTSYAHKSTCRAVANRLALLVERGAIAEGEARVLLDTIASRWNNLKTERDFDAFVAHCALGDQLKLCKRSDEDFERVVAPALAAAIKESIKAGPVVDAGTALASLLSAFKGFLQQHGRPLPNAPLELIAELGSLIRDLRAQADASLQAGTLDALVTDALQRRGVPTVDGFGPALKVKTLIEYLASVEDAAAGWQKAGKRWQKYARRGAPRDDRFVFADLPWGPAAARQAEARGANRLTAQPLVVPPGAVKIEKAEAERLRAEYLDRFPEMKRYFESLTEVDSGDLPEGSLVVIRWPRVFEDKTNDGLVCTVVQVASREDDDTYYDLCAGDKDLRVAGCFLYPAPMGAREGDVLQSDSAVVIGEVENGPYTNSVEVPSLAEFVKNRSTTGASPYTLEEGLAWFANVESYSEPGTPTEVPVVVHKHDSEEPTC